MSFKNYLAADVVNTVHFALLAASASSNKMLAGASVKILCTDDKYLSASKAESTGEYSRQQNNSDCVHYLGSTLQALGAVVKFGENVTKQNAAVDKRAADFVFFTNAHTVAKHLQKSINDSCDITPIYVPIATADTETQKLVSQVQREILTAGFKTSTSLRAGLQFYKHTATNNTLALCTDTQTAVNYRAHRMSAAKRILWAAENMKATHLLAKSLPDLSQHRVLVSLVLEPKTAALALLLKNTGAKVAVFAAAAESDSTVAAELRQHGIEVFAGQNSQQDAACAQKALKWQPTLLIDDGSHLIRLAHTQQQQALKTLQAASEETTSGVRPLAQMQAEQELKIPVVAANNARTKTLFDNRVGTGESCVFAIMANLGHNLYNKDFFVWGYGPVGQGVCRAARALGANVRVLEKDAVAAATATADGYEVVTVCDIPAKPFIGVSATGVWHTVSAELMIAHAEHAVWAVAGGIDDELALDDLQAKGWSVVDYDSVQDEKNVCVLAGGGGINYTACEGNPIEVMDLSFATQIAALEQLVTLANSKQAPEVLELSQAAETKVAAAWLAARKLRTIAPGKILTGGAARPWQEHRYRSPATTD